MALRRVVFALTIQIKGARLRAKGSPKKERARKKLILNPGFQPLKYQKKKDMATPGNLTSGLPVSGLMILGLQLQDGRAREITLLGGTLFESCLPSDTRGPRSGLHSMDWIEINNQNISATCMVLWRYNGILPL